VELELEAPPVLLDEVRVPGLVEPVVVSTW